MSKFNQVFENSDLSNCSGLRQTIIKLLDTEVVQQYLNRLADRSKFKAFEAKGQDFGFDLIEDAVDLFMDTCDPKQCENFIREHYDASENLHDFVRDVITSAGFSDLISSVHQRVARRFPEAVRSLDNLVTDIVLDRLIDLVEKRDKSRPLDLLKSAKMTVAYLPGLDREQRIFATTKAMTKDQEVATIIPERTLKTLLQLANVDKETWVGAVEEVLGTRLYDEDNLTAEAWKAARWTTIGKPIVNMERLVEAIDICRYGFSPMIAFEINAYKFVTRDWSKGFSVTGGIVGLHDFKYGSGEPLRFEGTAHIFATPRDFMLPEREVFGLSQCHGFTEDSFRTRMKEYDLPLSERAASINCVDIKGYLHSEYLLEQLYSLCSEYDSDGTISATDVKKHLKGAIKLALGSIYEVCSTIEKTTIDSDLDEQIIKMSNEDFEAVANQLSDMSSKADRCYLSI